MVSLKISEMFSKTPKLSWTNHFTRKALRNQPRAKARKRQRNSSHMNKCLPLAMTTIWRKLRRRMIMNNTEA